MTGAKHERSADIKFVDRWHGRKPAIPPLRRMQSPGPAHEAGFSSTPSLRERMLVFDFGFSILDFRFWSEDGCHAHGFAWECELV
jgi:hypothetical protein